MPLGRGGIVRFQTLGPVRVWDGAAWLAVQAAHQRAVLAILLAESGRVVSAQRLVDEIWGERPPRTAQSALQGYVMRLRRLLGDRSGSVVVTQGRGYQMVIAEGDLDAALFEQLVESGRRSLADGRLDSGVGKLSEALELWQGPALADVPATPTVTAEASRLEQCRLTALEAMLGAQLELGRHADVVDELQRQVAEHPLREGLRAHLMLALYRCGRRAEALEAYRTGRRVLVDELGLEPGPQLRELEQAILADDARLAAPARPGGGASGRGGATVPAQLPPTVAAFTGRQAHLRRLDALLPDEEANPPVLVISAIAGTPGVGKTALAVHWAHQVRDRFPDGQLYVNLRGYAAGPPLRPIEALARFLQALGVPAEEIPVDEEDAAGLYRSLLAGRRTLVLLDNAHHPDQVRPLLPGSAGCLVLITSRDQLGGLVARDGAIRMSLEPLTPPEASGLLAHLLGDDRLRTEPAAVGELAALCGYLPLALRIAAANLNTRPQRTIAGYTRRLRAGDRLAALEVDGDRQAAVRAAFDLSYAAQPADARQLFRLLGLVPGPDVTAPAAAALAGTSIDAAAQLLDKLAAAHLIEEHSADRYAPHDLLRLYAAEQATAEDSAPARRAALDRLFDHYLSTMDAAARLLYPEKLRLPRAQSPQLISFAGDAEAMAWLEAERPDLVAAVQHAAEHGPHPVAWRLADALRGYFNLRMHTVDWRVVANAGLGAAIADGQPAAQAAAHLSLATLDWGQSRCQQAIDHYVQALELAEQGGWREGHIAAFGNLGNVYFELGQLAQAAEHYTQALAILAQGGWRAGRANGLGSLGEAYHALGRLDEARTVLIEARALQQEGGARGGEAEAVRVLAAVDRDAGRYAEALDLARTALALARDVGDQRCEVDTLNTLGGVHQQLGRYQQAAGEYQRALDLAQQIGSLYAQAEALTGLAAAHLHAGHPEQAIGHAEEAIAVARKAEHRAIEGRALTVLAAIHLDQGRLDLATGHAEQALAIHADTGHRLGEARTLLVLERVLRGSGQEDEAKARHSAALALFAAIGAPPTEHARLIPEGGGGPGSRLSMWHHPG
jgi:DNA-binding SARP family transcriptional activator/Tfp pilus assembly protein PilF